ncbi:MAG: phenylacetate--CoA ligase family protein [Burkholderiales bacterium]|nr:phenylacetate--CoA ligase family protein [Burkholderiales bacterium]
MGRHEFRSALEGVIWPAHPGLEGARVLGLLWQLERSQWWTPERLAERQLVQLRRLLEHAGAHVPLYRERFARAGFDPRAGVTWDAFRRLPLLERHEIQETGEALCSEAPPPRHGRIRTAHTSGSTGRPISVRVSEATGFYWRVFSVREHLWRDRDFYARYAMIDTGAADGEYRGWDAALGAAFWTGAIVTLGSERPIAEQARWLLRRSPAYLQTYPSNLAGLARYFVDHGLLLPRLREARTYGEVLPGDTRALARRAWGVPVTDFYSCRELGPIALQCPRYEHLHVQSESVVVEVLDDAGEPCPPGAVGRVVLTGLTGYAMPLVRYAIGDYAEVGPPCPCGRGLPVLRRVLGRQRNLVTLPDGSRHWPTFPAEGWLAVAPVRQLRLVQRSVTHIEVEYTAPRTLAPGEQQRLAQWLCGRLGHSFRIAFTRVAAIARAPNGKFEDFVSEIAR